MASPRRNTELGLVVLGAVVTVALYTLASLGRTATLPANVGPLNFQPGEFAKITLAIFFAAYLVERRELLGIAARRIGPLSLPELRHFGPVLLAWFASLVVMFWEKDLGSSLLFFALFIVLLWVATERASYLAVGAVLFVIGAVFAWHAFGHVQ